MFHTARFILAALRTGRLTTRTQEPLALNLDGLCTGQSWTLAVRRRRLFRFDPIPPRLITLAILQKAMRVFNADTLPDQFTGGIVASGYMHEPTIFWTERLELSQSLRFPYSLSVPCWVAFPKLFKVMIDRLGRLLLLLLLLLLFLSWRGIG